MDRDYYKSQEFTRAEKNLYKPERNLWGSSSNIAHWYVEKLKTPNYCCHYRETSIFDINKLIDAGLLKTRSVRGKGQRVPVLEIDKNDDTYLPENCVLSCYYCNNDKSYTSSKED
jgi:hypothetical protein